MPEINPIITDLHIHSRFSRGCSTDLTIKNLEKYAGIKGIDVLGTGDFTHPKWIEEIKAELKENTAGSEGIFETKDKFKFILSSEISLIYSQGGKGRRVHNIILAPSIEVVEQITEQLKKHGRVDYDGRPIFGISCPQFTEEIMGISKEIEIIPAHAWTPWFSMFGSNSGFNSMKECFGDQLKNIHALETGLSSDPPMNWRLSQLDNINILSFSDSHSYWPWRLGRETTLFSIGNESLTYKKIIQGIRTGEDLWGTIEVDPNYGKYHLDGHRKCSVCFTPKESKTNNNICPVCKKKLTIGVLNRVEELADRPEGYYNKNAKNAKEFKTLIPLPEIISFVLGKGMATKGVTEEYYKLQKAFGSEFNILLNAGKEELEKHTLPEIADAVIKNREGKIIISPGYDGEYGAVTAGITALYQKKAKKARTEAKSTEMKTGTKIPAQASLTEF